MDMLDMNDPDFFTKLAEAVGLKEGEAVVVMTPQFDRVDGIVPAELTRDVLGAIAPNTDPATLEALGLQVWSDEVDANGHALWLFPAEWYPKLPAGLKVETISGRVEEFEPGKTDDDQRFGALSFGIRARPPVQKEAGSE